MSIFSSIQVASNALLASQVGLHVTGNNIANANTPGYLRQELVLQPAPTQRIGDLLLGLGVDMVGVVQRVDKFLERRILDANSGLRQSEANDATFVQLESLVGELSDSDLSTALSNFFSAIHDVANQPESTAVRNIAALRGESLTRDIQTLAGRVRDIQGEANQRITNAAKNVNTLLKKIADLNVKIVTTEGGDTTASDAVGLRDQQLVAINELSELVEIRISDELDGSISIYAGGDVLVFSGIAAEVHAVNVKDDRVEVRVKRTDAPLATTSGQLAGLYQSRDEILGGFLDDLDEFTRVLAFEFNKVHTGGQGLTGYSELTSDFAVGDVAEALDQVDLPYTPINGSFQVQVRNKQTGLTEAHDIFIQLNGLDGDTTATDLVTALSAIDGITAGINGVRKIEIAADAKTLEFGFANDTSGVLAALGINTFFTATSARDIQVSAEISADPTKLAASRGGIGEDSANLEVLADFYDYSLSEQGGESLAAIYERLVGTVAQEAAVSRSATEGLQVFQRTLEGQKLATSGVSLDEEAVKMIKYQRVYQATARYIRTLSDLLDSLVNL